MSGFALVVLLASAYAVDCAPVRGFVAMEMIPRYPSVMSDYEESNRLGSVGDLISGSSWFPIEVNVPDVINNIVGGVSGAIGGTLQSIPIVNRLPIVNRITSAFRPRPRPYFLLLALRKDQMAERNTFDPFDATLNRFPMYP